MNRQVWKRTRCRQAFCQETASHPTLGSTIISHRVRRNHRFRSSQSHFRGQFHLSSPSGMWRLSSDRASSLKKFKGTRPSRWCPATLLITPNLHPLRMCEGEHVRGGEEPSTRSSKRCVSRISIKSLKEWESSTWSGRAIMRSGKLSTRNQTMTMRRLRGMHQRRQWWVQSNTIRQPWVHNKLTIVRRPTFLLRFQVLARLLTLHWTSDR